MVYCDTEKIERIWFAPESNEDDLHCFEMCKSGAKCYVTIDGDDDWMWVFKLDDSTNYEVVKYTIMDAMFKSCCVDRLKDNLDIAFEDCFAEILADDDCDAECECGIGHCCENCISRECLD